jgi:hypothetical protein
LIHLIYYIIHQSFNTTTTNNNNQAFYSQASWGRLEMKTHEPKTGIKQEQKIRGVKTKGDKKPNRKRRECNKMLSQKSEKGQEKT